MIRAGFVLAALLAGGCVPAPMPQAVPDAAPQPVPEQAVPVPSVAAPSPVPAPARQGPANFLWSGELTQGGWIRGTAPAGAVSARLDNVPLMVDPVEGTFFAAFDRDAGPAAQLIATLADGQTITSTIAVVPRAWQIEHVNAARRPGGSTEEFMAIRRPELERIAAARAVETGAQGWRQRFIRPSGGRISGRFGSQRVYRGEPAAYHSGLDLAGGAGGPVVAPAAGVVVLAADAPFTLEGNLLIIDHGQGLNSAFLHLSQILVRPGEAVAQGQLIGRIGATGRATGPHLHWSLKWREARLDPLLFLEPEG